MKNLISAFDHYQRPIDDYPPDTRNCPSFNSRNPRNDSSVEENLSGGFWPNSLLQLTASHLTKAQTQ